MFVRRWLLAVLTAVVLTAGPQLEHAGASAQIGTPAPLPELGAVVVDDPLTGWSDGVVQITQRGFWLSGGCQTDRNSGAFVDEGYSLRVVGPCGDDVSTAAMGHNVNTLIVPDGEIRLDFRAVDYPDRTLVILRTRVGAGGYGSDSYSAVVTPAFGQVFLIRLADGAGTVIAKREDAGELLTPNGWNSVAIRAQGPNLWVLVNDQPVLAAVDSTHGAGGVGFSAAKLGEADDGVEVAVLVRNLRVSGLARGDQARLPLAEPLGGAATATTPPAPPALTLPQPPAAPQPPIDGALMPAWEALAGLERRVAGEPIGARMRRTVEETGVRLTVGPLPAGTAGRYAGRANTITVNQDLIGEDPRAIAAVLAHELTHAAQVYRGEGGRRDCVRMEVDAYGAEAVVWSSFRQRGYGPSRTGLERDLDALVRIMASEGEPGLYKLVVSGPGYQAQCDLWVP